MIKLSNISTIVAARAEKPAIVSPLYSISWEKLEESVRNLVMALQANLDTECIQQAVFLSENKLELVILMSAFTTLGIPLCGIDYTLNKDAIKRAMKAVSADCLIVASECLGVELACILAREAECPVIDMDNIIKDTLHISKLLLPHPGTWGETDNAHAAQRPFRSVAFTSGTSGEPKPVIRHHPIDTRRFTYFTQRVCRAWHVTMSVEVRQPGFRRAEG